MNRYFRPFRVGLVLLVFQVAAVQAEDWPQFRGPTRQGISTTTGLPVSWDSETGENITWKQTVPGFGWSSPVVVAGRIYLTTAVALDESDEPDYSLRALCLDAKTGSEIWNVEVFPQPAAETERIHGKNSHASPTPIVDDGQMFVHFGTHGTACLDLQGNIIWKTNELVYQPQHGNGGAPALIGDALVISCDGIESPFIVCLERSSGNIRWKVPRETFDAPKKFAFNTPLAIDVNGKTQVVSSGVNSVSGFDLNTGEAIWTVRYDGFSVVPRPLYQHGLVYICTGFGTPWLLVIDPTGSGNVTETHVKWKTKTAVPHSPSAVIVGDELYMVSDKGVASCWDAKSGKMHWRHRVGGNFSASLVYADGRIYLQDEGGKGTVIAAAKEFKSLGSSNIGEPTLASYAISDGALFLRSKTHLYRIESR